MTWRRTGQPVRVRRRRFRESVGGIGMTFLALSVAVLLVGCSPEPAREASPEPQAEPTAHTEEDSGNDVTTKGLLGVRVRPLSEEDQIGRQVQLDAGVLVAALESGSAAAMAGVAVGDIITAVNGTPATTLEQLSAAMADAKAGETCTVEIQRFHEAPRHMYETMSFEIILGEHPDELRDVLKSNI